MAQKKTITIVKRAKIVEGIKGFEIVSSYEFLEQYFNSLSRNVEFDFQCLTYTKSEKNVSGIKPAIIDEIKTERDQCYNLPLALQNEMSASSKKSLRKIWSHTQHCIDSMSYVDVNFFFVPEAREVFKELKTSVKGDYVDITTFKIYEANYDLNQAYKRYVINQERLKLNKEVHLTDGLEKLPLPKHALNYLKREGIGNILHLCLHRPGDLTEITGVDYFMLRDIERSLAVTNLCLNIDPNKLNLSPEEKILCKSYEFDIMRKAISLYPEEY